MKVYSFKDLKILLKKQTNKNKKLQATSNKLRASSSKDLGITTSGKPEFDHDWLDKSIIND
jgi:hypothetical protein